jgi:hypothetical protein
MSSKQPKQEKFVVLGTDWILNWLIAGTVGAISATLVLLAQQKTNSIVIGKRPNSWTTGRNIEGFFANQTYLVLVPTITALFLCVPWLFDRAQESRFQLQLWFALRKVAKRGASARQIFDILLKVIKNDFTQFTEGSSNRKRNMLKYAYKFEKYVWKALSLLIATGVTLYLVVTQTGLATHSSTAQFASIESTRELNQTSADCLQGDWTERAVRNSRQTYVTAVKPISQAIYALGEVQNGTLDVPLSVIGFGNGLSIWMQPRGDRNETWRALPAYWRVTCNVTDCNTYTVGDVNRPIRNPVRYPVKRLQVRESFNQLSSIDANLIALASSSSYADDKALESIGYTQAVSYTVLTGVDESVASDVYRAGYLISIACGIESSKLEFEQSWGFSSVFTIKNWKPRPVTVLTACTTVWYQPEAFVGILFLIFATCILTLIPSTIMAFSWVCSSAHYWWPSRMAMSENGPLLLMNEFPIEMNIDHNSGDFVLEREAILGLYGNRNTLQVTLREIPMEREDPNWVRLTGDISLFDIRWGKYIHDNPGKVAIRANTEPEIKCVVVDSVEDE